MLHASHLNLQPCLPCWFHAQVVNANKWNVREQHVCDREGCKGHVWSYLPKKDWLQHKDDACPECHEPRFNLVKRGSRTVLEPYR
jgi:hypothetical protein